MREKSKGQKLDISGEIMKIINSTYSERAVRLATIIKAFPEKQETLNYNSSVRINLIAVCALMESALCFLIAYKLMTHKINPRIFK